MNWDWSFAFDLGDFFETGRGPRGRWRGPKRGFFRSGEVRLALLSLLADEPGHGYELMKRLEERSGGLYRASAGTVYPVLQQLEDEGLVASIEEGGKRVYRITGEGRRVLAAEKETVDRIWRRAGRWREWGCHLGPDTVEVAAAVGRLTKTAFRRASEGDEETRAAVIEALNRARREIDTLG